MIDRPMGNIGVQNSQDSEVSPGDDVGLVRGLLISCSISREPDGSDVASGACVFGKRVRGGVVIDDQLVVATVKGL